jgi:hypothetical protein
MQASRRKLRRRRSGSGSGSDDDDAGSGSSGSGFCSDSADAWSSFDTLQRLQRLYYGDGGGSSGGGGGGSWRHGGGSDGGGDAWQRLAYNSLWVWQVLCAASLAQSWWFVLFPAAGAVAQPVDAATSRAARAAPVALAC